MHDQDAHTKVRDLMEDIKVCHVVTHGPAGKLVSRPMQMLECDDEDNLWFFTSLTSAKIMEIETNPEVLLGFSDKARNDYVSLSDTASFTQDRNRIYQLWGEFARVWFPKGKDDPDLVAMKVEPHTAEYWDSASSVFVIAYGYMKARMTGEAPRVGENKLIRF